MFLDKKVDEAKGAERESVGGCHVLLLQQGKAFTVANPADYICGDI